MIVMVTSSFCFDVCSWDDAGNSIFKPDEAEILATNMEKMNK
jgi:hypothetical protein